MTCYSCRYSIGYATPQACELWCILHDKKAKEVCDEYEREPGSDEEERETDD